ncbi:hydrogenase expression/formation protein HypE [Methylococcus capsulatus]|jgi:hydrogenase expression/formation protein HypE|nr:hydrogenase expression/formation protein HypE [Methylococcus capsulatus]QXP87663.1 hydrogenase expression/formation protein HypE [Methylococcus capsulatus]QXP90984.1 hydrogenase expression/formation protein HypE [Methylococcus capsulatus]QXP92597.1 hydrogenase expression/formation protein HypE [Methylococcus capsulatus]UQN12679.1 hydrogenase expression/formation protein HypE [Methylococcus capsulatus]
MNDDLCRDITRISLAHGNGGRLTREIIEEIFAFHLGRQELDTTADAARLPLEAGSGGEWMITTDGFTVEPLEFPGGDVGSLAVHGTVNDLAVSGAVPRFLSLNVFIEEGLDVEILRRIVASMARACSDCGVRVLAGDTKVVRRGQGGGLYLATTGLGQRRAGVDLGLHCIRPGDRVIVSGPVGDHGAAVLLAREQFGLAGSLRSDAGSVLPITGILLALSGLRFMRDPTRGGVATVSHEIARAAGATVRLIERDLPVRPEVRSVCEILGYDPYYLACEGRVVAVVDAAIAAEAVAALHQSGFTEACVAGTIEMGAPRVVLQTSLGGERILPELEDDPLPRIC